MFDGKQLMEFGSIEFHSRLPDRNELTMYRYQNVLVYCGLNGNDPSVVSFAGKIARLANSKTLTFSHFLNKIDIPKSLAEKYPWLSEPMTKQVSERLHEAVEEHAGNLSGIEVKADVREGHAVFRLLETASENDVDLIICGKDAGIPSLGERLSRKAPSSVCVVPDGNWSDFSKPMVAIDFSDHSSDALDVATAFASAQGISRITAVNVSESSPYASRAAIPEEEIRAMNRAHHEESLSAFFKEKDTRGLAVEQRVIDGSAAPFDLLRFAADEAFDLIVMGCRGKDAISSLLLGSTAEEVLKGAKVPVVAVKKKGTGKSFLESLLSRR